MKRMVKIGKRSVPLWVILVSLFIVTAAVAGFLSAITGSADLVAGSGVQVNMLPTCTMQAGLGQIDTCEDVAGMWVIEASELDNDAIIKFNIAVENVDTVPAYFVHTLPLAGDIDGVSEFDLNVPDGWMLDVGVPANITLYIHLADLVQLQVVDTINFQFGFTAISP